MIYDYFATLAAPELKSEQLDVYTTKYHYLIATGDKKKAEGIREEWRKKFFKKKTTNLNSVIDDIENTLKIIIPKIDLALLPQYSCIIQFMFQLKIPFLTRGEREFYIIDNPVLTDKVFQYPYISPSTWKGCLRSVLWRLGHKEDFLEIRRLFGNERGNENHELLREGRLYFFPTFYGQKSLEVINPHDRLRKVGKNPILMESVPQDSRGWFTLLYVPFDLIFEKNHLTQRQKQIALDLNLICTGLKAMFLDYGFGAKTSSGFGIAKPDINGKLQLKEKTVTGWEFKNFDELQGLVDKVGDRMNSGRSENCYES